MIKFVFSSLLLVGHAAVGIAQSETPASSICKIPPRIEDKFKKMKSNFVINKIDIGEGKYEIPGEVAKISNLFNDNSSEAEFYAESTDIFAKKFIGVNINVDYNYSLTLQNFDFPGKRKYYVDVKMGPWSFNLPSTNHHGLTRIEIGLIGNVKNFPLSGRDSHRECGGADARGYVTCYGVTRLRFEIGEDAFNLIADAPQKELFKIGAFTGEKPLCPIYLSPVVARAIRERSAMALEKLRKKAGWQPSVSPN